MTSRSKSAHDGEVQTPSEVKWLPSKPTCAIGAFVISGVAGVIIVALGVTNIFGAIGSVGFYASIAGGSGLAAVAVGGVISIAIWNCYKKAPELNAVTETRIEPYSELGQAALMLAREKRNEQTDIEAGKYIFGSEESTFQPVNEEIAWLTSLYWSKFQAFMNALKNHQTNTWLHSEVIEAADEFMQIGFAISCLTLEDLEAFTQKLEEKSINRTYAEALMQKDSYLTLTFIYCSEVYHWLRGEIMWGKDPSNSSNEGLFCPGNEVSKSHEEPFYQEGTKQYNWRLLYNEYCERVRMYVREDDLERANAHYVNWIQKDEARTFIRHPDIKSDD